MVGSVIRDRIFSSVDLPAPLRPMMPRTSPLHFEIDILQGPELLDRVALHDLPAAHNIGRLARYIAHAALQHIAEIGMAVVERPLGAMANEVAL